jgi:hypothetical protein
MNGTMNVTTDTELALIDKLSDNLQVKRVIQQWLNPRDNSPLDPQKKELTLRALQCRNSYREIVAEIMWNFQRGPQQCRAMCVAGSATIETKSTTESNEVKREKKRVDELRVGDLVRSPDGQFYPMLGWLHKVREITPLLSLQFADSPPLELSADHLLHVVSSGRPSDGENNGRPPSRFIRASEVTEGTEVVFPAPDGGVSGGSRPRPFSKVVVKIDIVAATAGAPVIDSPTGTYLANGAEVSNYAIPSTWSSWGDDWHTLAHHATSPIRAWMRVFGSSEWDEGEGDEVQWLANHMMKVANTVLV